LHVPFGTRPLEQSVYFGFGYPEQKSNKRLFLEDLLLLRDKQKSPYSLFRDIIYSSSEDK